MPRHPATPMPAKPVLAALVAQNKSPVAIAAELGVDEKTMRRWLAGYGLKTTHHNGRPFAIPDAVLPQIRALAAQGLSPGAVSRHIHADARTVERALVRAAAVEKAQVQVERSRPSDLALWFADPLGIRRGQAVEDVAPGAGV